MGAGAMRLFLPISAPTVGEDRSLPDGDPTRRLPGFAAGFFATYIATALDPRIET